MGENKQITFVGDHDRGMYPARNIVNQWYHYNKERIKILSGIYNVELADELAIDYHKTIVMRYNGNSGENPQTCRHIHIDKVIVLPTCFSEGSIKKTCLDCGTFLGTVILDIVDHNYSWSSNHDATCLKDGTVTGTCSYCDKQITNTDPGTALGHNHVWHSDNNATCVDDGTETGICTRCGDTITRVDVGSILDHEYVFTPNNDATCTVDGTETGRCIRGDKEITRTIPGSALGHNFIYSYDNNATCLTDGTETGDCSRCHVKTPPRVLPGTALGHSLPTSWTVRMASTCTQQGVEFKKCIRCDYEITQMIPALGHNLPSTWTLRTPATESAAGIEFRKCTRCSYEETRAIPKLEHTWVSNGNGTHRCTTVGGCGVTNETCSPNGYGQICSKCGYKTPEDVTLVITTDYINGMTVGNPFSQWITANVTSGVDWDIATGIIPPGLVFYRTGELRGTPNQPGIYNFSLKAVYNGQVVTKAFSVNVASIMYTVTFNPQGGSVSETSRRVAQGSTIGALPTPTKNGFDFGGWFTAAEGGLKIDATYSVSSNVTLYARWGQGSDVEFGDVTSQFNIQYDGDRTNYNNNPYTIYHRMSNGSSSNLAVQTGVSSVGNSSNMTSSNKTIKLYMKVTNNGAAGNFDIGFDCDSYVNGNDRVTVTRIANGVQLASYFTVTVPYASSVWVGKYNIRVENRYKNVSNGANSNGEDSGYAFTMNNIFINSGSYTILEITFQKF